MFWAEVKQIKTERHIFFLVAANSFIDATICGKWKTIDLQKRIASAHAYVLTLDN